MGTAENTTILVLPGMDGTGELLTALLDQLSLHHLVQLTAYPTDEQLGYDQLVTFVVERAPKGQFVILGESFSGPIAIEVAATDRRVVGLILASSFARHPMPELFAPLARIFDMKWVPTSIVVRALLGSTGTPGLKSRLIQAWERLPREIIRARVSEALRVDKRNRLCEITCPMLCLHGRFDRLVSKKCVDEITSAQPGCQVRWFDASHMLLETHADEAAKAINEFCEHLH
jgi:pimeloyl-[acyl-carrier protein] methyl ester esterase